MKHKEKRLEYVHQYRTRDAKEWQKVVFSDEKKLYLDSPDGFQEYWHAKNFPEENYSTRHSKGGSLMIRSGVFSSSGKLNLQFFIDHWQIVVYEKMLNNLSLAREGRGLCGEEWIFQQDNAAIHYASITKKYLLEQKIRFLDHPACSPDLNPIENLRGLIVAKVYEGGRQYSAISEIKKRNLRRMEKNTFGSTSETRW